MKPFSMLSSMYSFSTSSSSLDIPYNGLKGGSVPSLRGIVCLYWRRGRCPPTRFLLNKPRNSWSTTAILSVHCSMVFGKASLLAVLVGGVVVFEFANQARELCEVDSKVSSGSSECGDGSSSDGFWVWLPKQVERSSMNEAEDVMVTSSSSLLWDIITSRDSPSRQLAVLQTFLCSLRNWSALMVSLFLKRRRNPCSLVLLPLNFVGSGIVYDFLGLLLFPGGRVGGILGFSPPGEEAGP